MTIENANEFVEKFFTDDDFMLEVLKASGYTAEKLRNETGGIEENAKIVLGANKLGYGITLEEFENATKDYFEKLGGWKALNRLFQIGQAIKKAPKDKFATSLL